MRATIESLRADGVEIVAEPHVIFSHTDDSLGPAGMDEWMAFVKDSEGNTSVWSVTTSRRSPD